jgi:hypothetical protein
MDMRTKILLTHLKKRYSVNDVLFSFENFYKDIGPDDEVEYIIKNPEDKEAVFAYLNARTGSEKKVS